MAKREISASDPPESGVALSRRQMLIGAATAAIAASVPTALASSGKAPHHEPAPLETEAFVPDVPVSRYMSATACLADGRIFVAGGYSRPFSDNNAPIPMSSAGILDPYTGSYTPVASMNLPRARHAMVVLRDGRIVVLGGYSQSATASVEVYDPRTNTWKIVDSLNHPRYDHSAAYDGANIFILGGSAQNILSTVEVIRVGGTVSAQPL